MTEEWYLPPELRAIRKAKREEQEREQAAGAQPTRPIPKVLCSFCFKSEPDVERVWGSVQTAICTACIECSYEALVKLRKAEARKQSKPPA